MPQIRILNSPIENETDPVLLNGSQILPRVAKWPSPGDNRCGDDFEPN
jgi:hypothetical protein